MNSLVKEFDYDWSLFVDKELTWNLFFNFQYINEKMKLFCTKSLIKMIKYSEYIYRVFLTKWYINSLILLTEELDIKY